MDTFLYFKDCAKYKKQTVKIIFHYTIYIECQNIQNIRILFMDINISSKRIKNMHGNDAHQLYDSGYF